MNCKLITNKAFTIIELVVAVALMAVVFLFAGSIFKVSISAYRTSVANAEIMQKFRAITDQINADFKGAIWNCPGKVYFGYPDQSYNAYNDIIDVRSDSIVFFASGDFQSTEQYNYGGPDKTVVGNVACIFYSLADVNTFDPKKKILMRRQIIIVPPEPNSPTPDINDLGEYCTTPRLAEIIAQGSSFDTNSLMGNGFNLPGDFVNYMAKGVDDFTIQYVGTEIPPDLTKKFNEWRPDNNDVTNKWSNKDLIPIAFKFTFTLYDSKAVLKEGRKFTHIVYLSN